MAKLSPAQIAHVAITAGGFRGEDAALMVAIAMGESGGNTDATGDVTLQNATFGPSFGLWQVRSIKAQTGTGQERDASRLKDPFFNARSAASIRKSQGLNAWTVFSKGIYKKFLPAARLGVARPDANIPVGSTPGGATGTPETNGPSGSNPGGLPSLLSIDTSGIAKAAGFFTDTGMWLRLGMFLAGVLLTGIAVWKATGVGNVVVQGAKKVVSARTGGLVNL